MRQTRCGSLDLGGCDPDKREAVGHLTSLPVLQSAFTGDFQSRTVKLVTCVMQFTLSKNFMPFRERLIFVDLSEPTGAREFTFHLQADRFASRGRVQQALP